MSRVPSLARIEDAIRRSLIDRDQERNRELREEAEIARRMQLPFVERVGVGQIFERPPAPCIYFVSSPDAPGFVKIGFADNFIKRIVSLQCGNPHRLDLIIATEFAPVIEGDYHAEFHAHRHRGEWFRLAPEIVSFIRKVSAYRGPGYARLP